MAFPTIPTTGTGRLAGINQLNTTATLTGPNLNLLTGRAAGDLVIAIAGEYQSNAGTDAAYTGWAGGGLTWTEIRDSTGTAVNRLGVAYTRLVTGTETGAVTVTRSGTLVGDASMIIMAIPGAHASTAPEVTVMATAANSNPGAAPATLTPSWGAEDTLWVGANGSGMTSATSTWTANNGPPVNYTDYFGTAPADTSTIGDFGLAVAFLQNNAASETMAGFDVDSTLNRTSALLIAVRPVLVVPPNSGSATGANAGLVTLAGSATGERASAGSTTATVATAGSATGARISAGSWSGLAVDVIDGGDTATPPTDIYDAGDTATPPVDVVIPDVGVTIDATATGTAPAGGPKQGAATGMVTAAGTATGTATHEGAATGQVATAGTAVGAHVAEGAAAGTVTAAGSAAGSAPTVGVNDGSATGAVEFAGSAVGQRQPVGTAAGTVTAAGTGSGERISFGATTGTVALAGSATGGHPLEATVQFTVTVAPTRTRAAVAVTAGRETGSIIIVNGTRQGITTANTRPRAQVTVSQTRHRPRATVSGTRSRSRVGTVGATRQGIQVGPTRDGQNP